MSGHNSKNWPQGNENKPTLELKTNCTKNNQDDAGQTTDGQLPGDCQNRLLFLQVAPSLSL